MLRKYAQIIDSNGVSRWLFPSPVYPGDPIGKFAIIRAFKQVATKAGLDSKYSIHSLRHKTSTEYAPWYIIPANRKWYRNLIISRIIIDTLEGLDMKYPEPEDDLSGVVID
jgi:hypothetical protein